MRDLTRRFIRERRRRYIRKGQDLRVPRTRDTRTRTRFIRVTHHTRKHPSRAWRAG